ncbi:MAG: Ig-like domain-containing protein [Kiritimatiellae bacterium]|nr:Ig-like domain-containing protein [Kiritimatiellia bacterium]
MVLLAPVWCLADGDVLDDDFEGQATNGNPSGWTLTGDPAEGDVRIVDTPVVEGTRGCGISRTGASTLGMYRTFAAQTGLTVFRFAYRRGEADLASTIIVKDSSGNNYIRIRFNASGQVESYSGGWDYLADYAADTWYWVRIEVDGGFDTYDVFLNGVHVGDDMDTEAALADAARLDFEADAAGADVYVDDVEVYTCHKTWDRGFGNHKWTSHRNWNPDNEPNSSHDVICTWVAEEDGLIEFENASDRYCRSLIIHRPMRIAAFHVNSALWIAEDLVIEGDAFFDIGNGYNTTIYCGGDYNCNGTLRYNVGGGTEGLIVFTGQGTIDPDGSKGTGLSDFYDVTVTGTNTLAGDLEVDHDLTVSGTLDLSGYDLMVKGDAIITGTLNVQNGTVTILGTLDTAGGVLDNGTGVVNLGSLWTLGGYVANHGTFNYAGVNQVVTNTTYYNLQISGAVATLGGVPTVSNKLEIVSGGELLLGADTVTLGPGAQVEVDAGGALIASGATFQSTAAGEYFGMTVNGSVDIDQLLLNRLDNSGLTVNNGALITSLANVTYTNGQNGADARYLYIGHNAGNFSFVGHAFDANCTFNVVAPNGASVAMQNSSGEKGGAVAGEANDGTIDDNITWADANSWLGGEPSGPTLWSVSTNWSKGTVPTANELVIIPDRTFDPVLDVDGECFDLYVQTNAALALSMEEMTLDLGGRLQIDAGGTVSMTASSAVLKVGAKWVNNGTFNAADGTVTFDGTVLDQTIPAETFNHLTIEKGAKTATSTGNLTVKGDLRVTSGVLDLDDDLHVVAGQTDIYGKLRMWGGCDLTVSNAVSVKQGAELNMQDACTLRLGHSLTIEDGVPDGKFTAGGATPTITWNGSTRYAFTVYGAIGVGALNVSYPDANGLTIDDGAVVTRLDYVTFSQGLPAGTTYLRVLDAGAGYYYFVGHTLDPTSDSCLYNVHVPESSSIHVYMIDSGGDNGGIVDGPANENDPGSHVDWFSEKTWGGKQSQKWTTSAAWAPAGEPNSTHFVRVPDANIICEVDNTNAACRSLTISEESLRIGPPRGTHLTVSEDVSIETGGALIVWEAGSLYVGGNWTDDGFFSATDGGTVVLNGDTLVDKIYALPGTETFLNLTVPGRMTIADGDGVTVEGVFDPSGGTINAGSNTTLTTTGNWLGTPASWDRDVSTVVLKGIVTEVPAVPYHNLTIDGTCTLASDITVYNNLVINEGASLDLGPYTITVMGNVSNAGTLDLGTGRMKVKKTLTTTGTLDCDHGTVEFNGTVQTIPAQTYYAIDVNGPTVTLAPGVTVSNVFLISSGELTLANSTLTFGDGGLLDVHDRFTSEGGTLASTGAGACFGIDVSGMVNVFGLTIDGPDTNGLTLQASTTVQALDNVTFTNGQGGADSRYLWVGHSAGTFTFSYHELDANCATNVMAPNGAFVSMVSASGDGAGEAKDGPIDDHISWDDPNLWLGVDPVSPTLWSVPTNWSKVAVPVASDVVIIPERTYFPEVDVNAVCAGVIVQTNAYLRMSTADITLDVGGNVNVKGGGTLVQSNGTATLRCEGAWIRDGFFEAIAGIVCFDSTNVAQTIPPETFAGLQIDKIGQTADTSGLITVNSNLLVTAGMLRLDNQILNVDGACNTYGEIEMLAGADLKVKGPMTVQPGGDLDMQGACTLRLGHSLTVANGATRGRLYASGITPTITWDSISRYSFTINGQIYMNGVNFEYPNVNGLTINDGAIIVDIDKVNFRNGPSGGTYLRVFEMGAGIYYFESCDFDNNCGTNVQAAVGSSVRVTMFGATGPKAGEPYDNDPDEDHVFWYYQKIWDGSTSTDWDESSNWSDNSVPVITNDVIVPASMRPCVLNVTNAVCASMQVGDEGVLYIGSNSASFLSVSNEFSIKEGGTFVLQNEAVVSVGGNWANDGEFVLGNATASGTIIFHEETLVDPVTGGPGTEYFDNLTVPGTMTITDGDGVTVLGTFDPSGGTIWGGDNTVLTTYDDWGGAPDAFYRETSTVVLKGTSDVPIVTYYNLTIDGSYELTNDVVVMNDLVVSNGASLNLNGYTITVAGDVKDAGTLDLDTGRLQVAGTFTIPGTFVADHGTVEFNGSAQVAPSADYYDVEVTAGSMLSLAAAVVVSNQFSVLDGQLKLNSSTLTFASGAGLDVDGLLTSSGGTLASAGAGEYFAINIDGYLNVDGLTIDGPDDNGLTIQSTATIQALDHVSYTNGQNGTDSRYLWLGHDSGTFILLGHNIDTGSATNVIAPNGGIVSMVYSTGDGAGEARDGPIDEHITWDDPNIWLGGEPADPTLWSVGTNWSKGWMPTATEIALIPERPFLPELDVDGVCAGLMIQTNASLTMWTGETTLDVFGNVNVNGGGLLIMSNDTTRLNVGGAWVRAGAFQPHAGTVCFNSTTDNQTLPAETFPNLEIDKTGKIADTSGLINVTSNLTVTAGTLRLSGQVMNVSGRTDVFGVVDLQSGGDLKVTGPVQVRPGGTWNMQGACTLRLGTSLTVDSGATRGVFTASGDRPTVTWDSLTRYSFEVYGKIQVDGLNFNYGNTNGLTVSDGAFIVDIDNVDFNNGLASGTYLRVLELGGGLYYFNNHDFDNNCLYNVEADPASGASFNMIGATGARFGEDYDNDPGDHVHWYDQFIWDGSTSTNWSEPSNWSANRVPSLTNDCAVPIAVRVCHVNVSTAECSSIVIGSGGELYVADTATDALTVSNAFTIESGGLVVLRNESELRVGGDWVNNGTFTLAGGTNSGTVVFTGGSTVDKTTGGAGTEVFDNLTVSGAMTIMAGDGVRVTGTFTPSGTINAGVGTTLTTVGDWAALPSAFNKQSSTVVLQGTSSVPNVVYHNLTIGGECTLSTNITVANDLTINNGAILHLGAFTLTVVKNVVNSGTLDLDTGRIEIAGTFTTTGTFDEDHGTVEFNGASQTIPAETYYDIWCDGGTVSPAAGVTVSNQLAVLAGTLALGNKTVTFAGGASLAVDAVFSSAGGTLTSTGAGSYFGLTVNGTLNVDGLTIRYADTNGLLLQAAATVQALDNVTYADGQNGPGSRYLWVGHAAGTLIFTGHELDTNSEANVVAPYGVVVSMVSAAGDGAGESTDGPIDENITWDDPNIWFGGEPGNPTWWSVSTNWSKGIVPSPTDIVLIPDRTYDPEVNVDAVCAGIILQSNAFLNMTTASTTLDLRGNLNVRSGGTVVMSNATTTLEVGGTWTMDGLFSAYDGTVRFDSDTTDQAIPQTIFHDLEISNATRTATTTGNLTVNGDLTVRTGTLNLSDDTHTVAGTTGIAGTLQMVAGCSLRAQGALTVNAGGVLSMDGYCLLTPGHSITVEAGATNGLFTTTGATPAINWDGVTRYAFTVNGTVEIIHLSMSYPDGNGLTVNDGATIVDIDYLDCNNSVSTGTFLRVLSTAADSFWFTGCDFDNTCLYNVMAPSNSAVTVNMIGSTGARAGEDFDDDTGWHVNWYDQNVWDGSTDMDWDDPTNWSSNAVPWSGASVYIAEGANICNLNINTARCQTIEIGNNGTLVIDDLDDLLTVDGSLTLTSSGDLILSNGQLRVSGAWSVNRDVTAVGGTVIFDGNTVMGGTGLTKLNDVQITGQLTAPAGRLHVRGNWDASGGTFVHNSGTVVFDGTGTQTITSGGAWNGAANNWKNNYAEIVIENSSASSVIFADGFKTGKLTATNSAGATVYFAAQDSVANVFEITEPGGLKLQGGSGTNLVLRRYGGSGTDQWEILPPTSGVWTVEYVDVADSVNSGPEPIKPTNPDSMDSGNNINWFGATRVELTELYALGCDARVRVLWRTASEVNNAGFYVHRAARAAGGGWTAYERLNRNMVPGVGNSTHGRTYEFVDTQVTNGTLYAYTLESVEFDGRADWYGPVEARPGVDTDADGMSDDWETHYGLDPFDSLDSLEDPDGDGNNNLAEYLAGTDPQVDESAPPPPAGGGQTEGGDSGIYKVLVDRDGIYRLTAEALTGAGVVLTNVDPRRIHMYNGGCEIPVYVAGETDGVFDPQDYVAFYGTKTHTRFTDTDVYWLYFAAPSGVEGGTNLSERMPERSGAAGGVSVTNAWHVAHLERDDLYWERLPDDTPDDDHWFFGVVLIAPWTPAYSYNLSPTLDHVAQLDPADPVWGGTAATVRIAFRGINYKVWHHVQVTVNGAALPDGYWYGDGEYVYTATLNQDNLADGVNAVRVTLPGDMGAPIEHVLINWLEVGYVRDLRAEAETVAFDAFAEGGFRFEAGGFTNSDIGVFRVGAAGATDVSRITGLTVEDRGGEYSAAFFDQADVGVRYLVLSADGVGSPAGILEDESSDLRSSTNGADYVIIAPALFHEAILPLAAYREAQGLRVRVVKMQDVYDDFNYGVFSPYAIREFLRYTRANWQPPAPRYVLLVGDATFDYTDNEQWGTEENYVPAKMVHSIDYGEVPADGWYVQLDAGSSPGAETDFVPEMYIGRFPARRTNEVAVLVAKTIAYEALSAEERWMRRVTFVADDGDPRFEGMCEMASALVAPGYTRRRIYLRDYASAAACKTDVLGAFEDGALILQYAGHGITDLWADEKLFESADIAGLTNTNCLPIVVTPTCANGYFTWPEGYDWEGIAELLVRHEGGGAVACFSPAGFSIPHNQEVLVESLFRAVFEDGNFVLGPAVARAKKTLAEQIGNDSQNINETFMLFGDPALRIKKWSGFVSETNLPSVVSSEPVAGAEGVLMPAEVRVVFSEAMDDIAVRAAWSLEPPVAGSLRWDGPTLVFSPDEVFDRLTTYTVGIRATAQDLAGNPLDGDGDGLAEGSPADDFAFSFTPSWVTLSGTITYSGRQTGTVWVLASRTEDGMETAISAAVAAPGTYAKALPAFADYWVKAFRDESGNGSFDRWEAWGASPLNPVRVTGDVANVDISLSDPVLPRDDFDGDGRTDLWAYERQAGAWHIQESSGSWRTASFGWAEAVPVPGDYDGDGRTDLAVYYGEWGMWFILGSRAGFWTYQFGWPEPVPVPADYDGDLVSDCAVYHGASGTWYVMGSLTGFRTRQFGWDRPRPVPADYDADRQADVAVYDAPEGMWYILASAAGFRTAQFGFAAAIPVPADYDGDGRADIAVYAPETGTWYTLGSTAGFSTHAFGWSRPVPVPGDFDGDGRADRALFDELTGTWYIMQSTAGFRTVTLP